MNPIYRTPARPEELEFIRQKYAILGPTLVAKALGRSVIFAQQRAAQMGIRYKEGLHNHLDFIREHAPIKGYMWCGQELGYHASWVAELAARHGIKGLKQRGVVTWRKPKCAA